MILPLDIPIVVQILGLGFVAGIFGGLLGVGGSTIVIPGLTLIFGYNQHLYQAAAMVVNVVICVPAAIRHYQAGAMTGWVLRRMLPLAVLFVFAGVWLSNRSMFQGADGGLWLGRILAVFMLYVIVVNIRRLWRPDDQDRVMQTPPCHSIPEDDRSLSNNEKTSEETASQGSVGAACVGTLMGLIAGLLGIGGGAVAVPLQQLILRLPLRCCIANSSAVICFSAALGAIYKNATLGGHDWTWKESLILALLLAPSGWLGGHIGAGMTHRLPVRQVRLAFICLMAVSSIKMAAIF